MLFKMKKLLLIGAVGVLGLTACKKDYECCTTVSDATSSVETCVTGKYSKKEVEDIETSTEVAGVTTETKCTAQ